MIRKISVLIFFLVPIMFVSDSLAGYQEELSLEREAFFTKKAELDGQYDEAFIKEIKVMINKELHGLQLHIERWSVQSGAPRDSEDDYYPHSLSQLIHPPTTYDNRPPQGLYANPVTASDAADYNARRVPFGWCDIAPGNFSYLTRLDDEGNVRGYMLVGYGFSGDEGMDVDGDGEPDGAIITLASDLNVFKEVTEYYDGGSTVTIQARD